MILWVEYRCISHTKSYLVKGASARGLEVLIAHTNWSSSACIYEVEEWEWFMNRTFSIISMCLYAPACVTSSLTSQTYPRPELGSWSFLAKIESIIWNWVACNSTSSLGTWEVRQVRQGIPGNRARDPAIPGWTIIRFPKQLPSHTIWHHCLTPANFIFPLSKHRLAQWRIQSHFVKSLLS